MPSDPAPVRLASFRAYDTLSARVVDLVPRERGRVRAYVCGLTVDGTPHLGHARSAVVFDVFARRLEQRGERVTLVRNVTDVDDKIIDRARAEGVGPQALAERNLAAYRAVLGRLGIRPADKEPRVTEHLGEIREMTRALVASGHAYEAGGSVWFSVASYADYGALSGQNLAMLREGTRLEPDTSKRDPRDFVLWKASKSGEPAWPSPWGSGRPGWHIECSAMSRHVLGEQFDVHGAGLDLRFPHNENERAQSESATGTAPMVGLWMHHGLLTVGREKMAKSVGNVLTADDALSRHSAEAIRAWLLSAVWRGPLELSEGGIAQAAASLDRLYVAIAPLEARAAGAKASPLDASAADPERAKRVEGMPAGSSGVASEAASFESEVGAALDDDLDTPRAIALAFARVPALAARASAASASDAAAVLLSVRNALAPLGVLQQSAERYVASTRALRAAWHGVNPAEVDRVVADRAAARRAGDFETADRLKAELSALAVDVRDGPDGTTWHLRARRQG